MGKHCVEYKPVLIGLKPSADNNLFLTRSLYFVSLTEKKENKKTNKINHKPKPKHPRKPKPQKKPHIKQNALCILLVFVRMVRQYC